MEYVDKDHPWKRFKAKSISKCIVLANNLYFHFVEHLNVLGFINKKKMEYTQEFYFP